MKGALAVLALALGVASAFAPPTRQALARKIVKSNASYLDSLDKKPVAESKPSLVKEPLQKLFGATLTDGTEDPAPAIKVDGFHKVAENVNGRLVDAQLAVKLASLAVPNSASWGKKKVQGSTAWFHKTAGDLNDRLVSLSAPKVQPRITAPSFGREAPATRFRVPKGIHLSGKTLSLDESMSELVVEGDLELASLQLSEHQTIFIAEGGKLVCAEEIQCASMIVRGELSSAVTSDQLYLHETAQANGLLQASSVQVVPGSLVNGEINVLKEPRSASTVARTSFKDPRPTTTTSLTVPKGIHLSGATLSLDESMSELVVEGDLELGSLQMSADQTILIAEGGTLACTEEIQCASMIVKGELSAALTTNQLYLHATAQANGLLQASSVQVVPGSKVNGEINILA